MISRQISFLIVIISVLTSCGRLITPERIAITSTSVPVVAAPTATPTASPTPEPPRSPTTTFEPATPPATPTPTVTPTPVVYVVQPGDTLLSIAIGYDIAVESIQTANGIIDPRLLQIGQVLVIPESEEDGSKPPPTPTPFPVTVQGVNFQRMAQGGLWSFGEIFNPGQTILSEVVVEVNLYDATGILLDTKAVFAQLDLLLPGRKIPFAALFSEPPSAFAQYQVSAISAVPILGETQYYVDFSAVETAGRVVEAGLYRVSGQLENNGEHDVEAIKLVATAYDAENQVLGQRQARLDVITLRSRARTAFTIDLIIPNNDEVTRYTVQAQGLRVP